MFVKAFFLVLWESVFPGLLRCGHDRDGPLAVEGRLLSGHELSRLERVPGRLADRFKASTGAAAVRRARPPREAAGLSRWRW